jgi:hypothetical protein
MPNVIAEMKKKTSTTTNCEQCWHFASCSDKHCIDLPSFSVWRYVWGLSQQPAICLMTNTKLEAFWGSVLIKRKNERKKQQELWTVLILVGLLHYIGGIWGSVRNGKKQTPKTSRTVNSAEIGSMTTIHIKGHLGFSTHWKKQNIKNCKQCWHWFDDYDTH